MRKPKLLLVALVCGSTCAIAGDPADSPMRLAALDRSCGAPVHLGQSVAAAPARVSVDTELLELHTAAVEAQGGALLPRPAQR